MSLTHIDELPTAPNRLTNYTTFTTDAPIFIDALTPFTEQLNLKLDALSNFKPNRWNMGELVETNLFPTHTPYTTTPDSAPKPSVLYISSIDQEFLYFKTYSQGINEKLSWFENIQTERGSVDTWGTSLNVAKLSNPMTRAMGRTEFNTKAIQLSNSLRDNTLSLQQVKEETDGYFNAIIDLGSVDGVVDETLNFGSITDVILTNDI